MPQPNEPDANLADGLNSTKYKPDDAAGDELCCNNPYHFDLEKLSGYGTDELHGALESIREELDIKQYRRGYTDGHNDGVDAGLQRAEEQKIDGNTSDGYHTFNELYEFCKVYNAALFNEWATQRKYNVYKSKLHSNGELPFGGGWFIVGAQLPTGQISNHYEMKDWGLFIIPEVPRGSEWDGHTPLDVLKRLAALAKERTEHDTTKNN